MRRLQRAVWLQGLREWVKLDLERHGWQGMTRKRYIKLLMALGVERNSAEDAARKCRETGRTYADDYRRRFPWLTMQKAFRKLGRSTLAVGNVLGAMSAAATAAASVVQRGFVCDMDPTQPANDVCGQLAAFYDPHAWRQLRESGAQA